MGIFAFIARIFSRRNRYNNNPSTNNSNKLNSKIDEPIPIVGSEHANKGENEETTDINSLSVETDAALRETDALTRHLPFLCEKMESTELITRLLSRKLITNMEADVIKAEKTSYEKNFSLIALIKKKRPEAMWYFTESLKETNQEYLAERILQHTSDTPNFCMQTSKNEHTNFQKALKTMYLERFQKVNPFSLPFTFDIENTWVSLALREDTKSSTTSENHAELFNKAFEIVKLLIIEGKPATGKTSLMRRIAYEWAKGYKEFAHYELVIYAEFRDVRCEEEKFKTIAELVRKYTTYYPKQNESETFPNFIDDEQFCMKHKILVLLDGYDESNLEKQCDELNTFLTASAIKRPLLFDVVLTTRPGYLSKYRGQRGRFLFADVLGFTKEEQKRKYISNHFSTQGETESVANIAAVHNLLKSNSAMDALAETPLFLTFICLIHERIVDGTISELYCKIVWWLLDRHQKDFPDRDLPSLFGFQQELEGDKFLIIQDHYLQFPQLHCLGNMALKYKETNILNKTNLDEFQVRPVCEQVGLIRKEETRDKSLRRIEQFHFPHRTVQEFLGALAFFHGENNKVDSKLTETLKFEPALGMDEFEKFLWRIVSSNQFQIIPARRSDFFERYTSLYLDLNIFSSATCVDVNNLTSCLQYCLYLTQLRLYADSYCQFSGPIDLSKISKLKFFCLESYRSGKIILQKMEKETFLFLPNNSGISVNLMDVSFKSARLFCDSVEYFSNVLKIGTMIKFLRIDVSNLEQNSSFFTVEESVEMLENSWFPDFFSDQEMNRALSYLSCAKRLDIIERRKAVCSISFEMFPEIEFLCLNEMIFPVDALLSIGRCFNLRSLIFRQCKIELPAWQSITKEISKSAVRKLTLTIDLFLGENCAQYFSYLRSCDLIETLEIESRQIDKAIWNSVEEQLVSSFCDIVDQMSLLKEFKLDGYFNEESKEKLRKACENKKIKIEVNFTQLIGRTRLIY